MVKLQTLMAIAEDGGVPWKNFWTPFIFFFCFFLQRRNATRHVHAHESQQHVLAPRRWQGGFLSTAVLHGNSKTKFHKDRFWILTCFVIFKSNISHPPPFFVDCVAFFCLHMEMEAPNTKCFSGPSFRLECQRCNIAFDVSSGIKCSPRDYPTFSRKIRERGGVGEKEARFKLWWRYQKASLPGS